VNGSQVEVEDSGASLLDVLREDFSCRSVKDGCSPQGQCGCCTVLVDGAPRVACVTPARRVQGREVITLEGLDEGDQNRWATAFSATGASQCGFCTPGIIMRFAGLEAKADRDTEGAKADRDNKGAKADRDNEGAKADLSNEGASDIDVDKVERSLAAHLCRCTGWRSVIDAWHAARSGRVDGTPVPLPASLSPSAPVTLPGRDVSDPASLRATIEGGVGQTTGPSVALGLGGFADDTAPADALVAVVNAQDEWVVAENRAAARVLAGKRQGRRTTAASTAPLAVPDGNWARTLQTSWVEPAYLETDAAWCSPGGEPRSPLANGGAFGAKVDSEVGAVARRLADEHGRAVRVLYSREDAVRRGPKRPPVAAGIRADGTGEIRVGIGVGVRDETEPSAEPQIDEPPAWFDTLSAHISSVAPGLEVEAVPVWGPPTSGDIRGAGWVEASVLMASLSEMDDDCSSSSGTGPASRRPNRDDSIEDDSTGNGAADYGPWVTGPSGGRARAAVRPDAIDIEVEAGDVLDGRVLTSYCIGAAHMALSWVTSEALFVDDSGQVHDLTIRSFGVLGAQAMPSVVTTIRAAEGEPVNGSDAVFAAVAGEAWRATGWQPHWPTGALS